MDKQSYNLSTDLLSGYTGVFVKIIMAIIIIYGFIMIVNFFRDKFLKENDVSADPQILDLLSILNKVFILGGFGFITGNILEFAFSQATGFNEHTMLMNIKGGWDYLTFGVILIFMGIGLGKAKKAIEIDNKHPNS